MLRIILIPILIIFGAGTATFAEEVIDIETHTFWRTEGEKQALQSVTKRLSSESLKVNIVEHKNYNDLRQEVSTRIGLGFPPEISHWIGGEDLAGLAKIGKIFIKPSKENTDRLREVVHPEVVGEIAIDGDIYAIPMGIHLQHNIIYNMELLNQVGVSKIPKTWAEFFELSRLLKAKGIDTYSGTTELWVVREMFNGVMASIGQRDFLGGIYDGKFTDPTTKAQLVDGMTTFLLLRDMLDEGAVNRNWSVMVKRVIDGEAAMTIIGDFAWSEIRTFAKGSLDKYACAGIPGKGSAYFGVDIFVSFNTGVGPWAEKFSNFQSTVLDEATQIEYLSYKGGLPVVKNIDANELNPCSKSSLQRWNDNPNQRYSAPGTRDSNKTAMVNVALSKIWNDKNVKLDDAIEILQATILPSVQ